MNIREADLTPPDSIQAFLADVLTHYRVASRRRDTTWANHFLASAPLAIRPMVKLTRYTVVKASLGQFYTSRTWAETPFIGIRDNRYAKSFQQGIYIAILLDATAGCAVFSLQQGTKDFERDRPIRQRLKDLKSLSADLRQLLGRDQQQLSLAGTGDYSRLYEAASILHTSYSVAALRDPQEPPLRHDLSLLSTLLRQAAVAATRPTGQNTVEQLQAAFLADLQRAYAGHQSGSRLVKTTALYRPEQAALRALLLSIYGDSCVICGQRLTAGGTQCIEAAHITPVGLDGATHIRNALPMCPNHHWAFDHGLFGLRDDLTITVSPTLHVDSHDVVRSLEGQRVALPPRIRLLPDRAALRAHRARHNLH